MKVITLHDIQVEARRVYGYNHFLDYKHDGLHGTSIRVGTKSSSVQMNEIACHSWYEQQAFDAVYAALQALPDLRK